MTEAEEEEIRERFRKNLKRLREEKELSLLGLSYTSDFDNSNFSKYENKREPQLVTLYKIAKALKINPAQLLDLGIDYTESETPEK